MRALTLVIAVLALVGIAGCGDDGCPSMQSPGEGCSDNGLHCVVGGGFCDCANSIWECTEVDDAHFPIRDMATRDLANPSD